MSQVRPRRQDKWLKVVFALVVVAMVVWLVAHQAPPPVESGDVGRFLDHKERWGAKTGADDDAVKIAAGSPVETTVEQLAALSRPESLPERGGPGGERFGPVEHTVYTIDAKLLRYKCEEDDDQDDHLVITDYAHPGPTMIVEIPDPAVVSSRSPWHDQIAEARRTFDETFGPTGRFTRRTAHIRVTGVGLFDFFHRQSGVAPNCIELHPVIRIEVLD
jgi:hypothetical protein